jgi:hypothetical protein
MGLLDFAQTSQAPSGLLSLSQDEQDRARQMGLLALASGMLRGDFGGGLAGFGQAYQGSKEAAIKNKLMGMQAANLQSEVDSRKAALQKSNDLMEFIRKKQAEESAPQIGSPQNFGVGMPSGGSMMSPDSMPRPGSWLMNMPPTQQLMMKAGGLDPTDIINANKPKWENVNGNLVNTNDPSFRGGFQPGFSVSSDGRATSWMPDGKGGLVFGAPQGAVDTYRAFQNVGEEAKAKYDPVKVFNNRTKQEEYVSRDQVAGQSSPSAQPGVNGNFSGDPAAIMSAIVNIKDPQERANAMAAFTEQAKRTQGFTQGANFAAGPSQADTNAAAADKAYQENVAKDVVGQRKNIMDAGSMAPQNIARYQQIGKLLSNVDGGTLTPMGTHLASLANSVGLKIDKDLPNKEAAASIANQAALELRSPAGGAGMPGAMSDADRNFLVSMTPNMAQSAQGRKQIIDSYVAVQQRNQQVAQFARNYEKKYGRLDNGFFDQLSAWSNSNPLFGAK